MDEDLRVGPSLVVPAAELGWRFSRASGPGGQGVNTTDSRVELFFDVVRSPALSETQRARAVERLGGRLVDGVLTVSAQERRAQLRNRQAARDRLRDLLADAVAPPGPARRATRPTRGSQRRRLEGKKRRGDVKRLRRSTDD
ncbi:alternative ribosome rescue aminoacyl-tRNA hydrolase ArfB [Kineococcus gynurae]|uniref:Alternative ribosome rescue aminoacyl-tRNA hydrolase ArfB n=1 Tax=Kineococcus gynurae TaxID=452979 RepID=A0ABV5LSU9_9ACTN